MRRLAWWLGGGALAVGVIACPDFAPDSVCGYPGFCGDGSIGNDTGIDAPPGCDITKDPKDSPLCVDDTVGIFVDAAGGVDTNPGTKASPMKTLGAALGKTNPQQRRLYVCAGTYPEDLSLDATHDGVSIYGGWKCQAWTYDAASQPLIGKTNLSAKLSGLTQSVAIEDVHVKAANGANPGDSSLAVLVANCANVTFTRVKLEAGIGQTGAPGTLTDYTSPTQTQLNGSTATGIDGGSPVSVGCPAGDTTVGGGGGYGNGQDGHDGTPGPSNKGTLAACSGSNIGGGKGVNGDGGADAPALAALGALTTAGWQPQAGGGGTHGDVGQGGGGGAGYSSSGGGGGGAGGCGGAGGVGGGGGGGSVSLATLSSAVSLTASTLIATTAGDGGSGAAGQAGQAPGGFYGGGLPPGCIGGNGGAGGSGGAGGGGAGGISVGVLYKGAQPMLDSTTTSQVSVAAKAGARGTGGNAGVNDGIAGQAVAVLQAP